MNELSPAERQEVTDHIKAEEVRLKKTWSIWVIERCYQDYQGCKAGIYKSDWKYLVTSQLTGKA